MRICMPVIVLVLLMSVGGCVSSKKYNARVADIEGLNSEVLELREELGKKEAENAAQGNVIESLEKERERLLESEKKLMNENDDLRYMIEANKLELTNDLLKIKSELGERDNEIKRLEELLRTKDVQFASMKAKLEELEDERQKAIEEKKKAVSELKDTYDELVSELNEEIGKGKIEVTRLKDKLSLSMVDKILFDSGSAKVKKEGKKVLDRVADILNRTKGKQIRIEGHTDNVPIGPGLAKTFPSNWELSTARATNVVRYLQDSAGVDPGLLSASGYAEYLPVASNETTEGKARNRRIEIVLMPVDIKRATTGESSGPQPQPQPQQ